MRRRDLPQGRPAARCGIHSPWAAPKYVRSTSRWRRPSRGGAQEFGDQRVPASGAAAEPRRRRGRPGGSWSRWSPRLVGPARGRRGGARRRRYGPGVRRPSTGPLRYGVRAASTASRPWNSHPVRTGSPATPVPPARRASRAGRCPGGVRIRPCGAGAVEIWATSRVSTAPGPPRRRRAPPASYIASICARSRRGRRSGRPVPGGATASGRVRSGSAVRCSTPGTGRPDRRPVASWRRSGDVTRPARRSSSEAGPGAVLTAGRQILDGRPTARSLCEPARAAACALARALRNWRSRTAYAPDGCSRPRRGRRGAHPVPKRPGWTVDGHWSYRRRRALPGALAPARRVVETTVTTNHPDAPPPPPARRRPDARDALISEFLRTSARWSAANAAYSSRTSRGPGRVIPAPAAGTAPAADRAGAVGSGPRNNGAAQPVVDNWSSTTGAGGRARVRAAYEPRRSASGRRRGGDGSRHPRLVLESFSTATAIHHISNPTRARKPPQHRLHQRAE